MVCRILGQAPTEVLPIKTKLKSKNKDWQYLSICYPHVPYKSFCNKAVLGSQKHHSGLATALYMCLKIPGLVEHSAQGPAGCLQLASYMVLRSHTSRQDH